MLDNHRANAMKLSNSQAAALRRAVLNGEYHLMLGAGASRESISSAGKELPGSAGLITQLSEAHRVEAEDGDLLWRIYDRAVEKVGKPVVYSWLRERFWGVTPPYWMDYFARAPWNTVWTLNIDDTFEAALARVSTETSRRFQTLNWDDDYRQGRALNVVHLHGVVNTDTPRDLVFSISEYARSAASDAAWPSNFRDSYGNSPFIILGARLRDEPDIEAVIARRRPAHSAPSFYVARSISSAMRTDLERWGLIPVEMSAEEFVLEWSELSGLSLEATFDSEVELALRLGQQFTELQTNAVQSEPQGHDLFGGDEPNWNDAVNNRPAELEWLTKAKMDIAQLDGGINSSSLVAYCGKRLTGRSTGLLFLGRHLREQAWRTFLFRGEGRLDIDAVLSFASDGRPTALLFDGFSDIADDINKLLGEARDARLSVVCLAVEDSSNEARIIGRVETAVLAHSRLGEINRRLTGTDSARIVDKLADFGRLGILESKTDAGRRQHFRGHELFDAMAQLENAPGFGRRVSDILKPLASGRSLGLVLIASYASSVGRQLLVIDAARMVGMDSDALVNFLRQDDELATLLSTDGHTIRTRHRWMALKPIVERLGSQAAVDIIRDGILSVSPRLNRKSQIERNPTTLLVGSFMAHSNLNSAFPGANIDELYQSLLSTFGDWSARYWEQRAILARRDSKSDISLLAKAESFALRAVELVPDTFSYTTLGTVLMEKASRSQVNVLEYYQRARKAFHLAAINQRDSNNLVASLAFLRSSLGVLERIADGIDYEEPEALLEIVSSDWISDYSVLALKSEAGERLKEELTGLRRKYDSFERNGIEAPK